MNTKTIGRTALALTMVTVISTMTLSGYGKAAAAPAKQVSAAVATSAAAQKTFTLAQLQQFNGKNGAAAYIAVDGVVYDVSTYFKGGAHNGAVAGKDQSAAFHGAHAASRLQKATVVGVMQGSAAAPASAIKPIAPITKPAAKPVAKPVTPAEKPAAPSAAAQKTFTLAQLQQFNGKNGAAAYIAVDGVVYDVSTYFKGGAHNGAVAGKDQSAAFHDEHSASKLKLATVVGVMQGSGVAAPAQPAAKPAPSGTAAQALREELRRLEREDDALELQEDALKRAYRAGELTETAYRAQKAALETQEDALEQREDEIHRALHPQGTKDHDDDDDDDDAYDD